MLKTTNYQLNKPEGTDPVRVDDFNENADVIDAALMSKAEILLGTYSGNGEDYQDIVLGYKPRFILVWVPENGFQGNDRSAYWGMAAGTLYPMMNKHPVVQLTETGFRVFYYYGSSENYYIYTNATGTHSYLAIL